MKTPDSPTCLRGPRILDMHGKGWQVDDNERKYLICSQGK
jgi:hypothetical protein